MLNRGVNRKISIFGNIFGRRLSAFGSIFGSVFGRRLSAFRSIFRRRDLQAFHYWKVPRPSISVYIKTLAPSH